MLLGGLSVVGMPVVSSWAQSFPSHPIRWLIGYAAGGGMDTVARMLADSMSKTLKQPVVIENRTGGSGTVAAVALINSPPDGYTLFTVDSGLYAVNPHLYSKLPYDPTRDFALVGLMIETPRMLIVSSSLGVNTVGEFVSYVKSRPPQSVSFGNPGTGSLYHLMALLLDDKENLRLTHVPYRGTPPAVTDIIGGRLAGMFVSGLDGATAIASGKIKALAVTTPKRLTMLPDIPTMLEAGYDLSVPAWSGIATVAGTSPAVIATLNAAMMEATKEPGFIKRMADASTIITGTSSEDAERIARASLADMGPALKRLNIKLD